MARHSAGWCGLVYYTYFYYFVSLPNNPNVPNSVKKKKAATPFINSSLGIKALGVLFIAAAAAIVLAIKCLSSAQYAIFYVLLGLGSSSFFYRSAQQTRFSFRSYNFNVVFLGCIAVPAALIVYNPIDRYKGTGCDTATSVTVFVHGKKGLQDIILQNKGFVMMDLQGERKRESINEKGQAVFHNLHVGDKVLLNIDFSEPYKAVYPDSAYTVTPEGRIYLPVALQGIDKVQGMVLYNEEPLSDVTVKIDDLTSKSDETGHYSIPIPESLQSQEYKVWFIKKGFKAKSVKSYPQTGQSLNIVMEK